MIGSGGDNCPFCAHAVQECAMYHSRDGYVLEPLNPVADGHLLLIPYSHYTTSHEGDVVVGMEQAGVLLKEYVRATGLSLEGYNLILNGGALASQTVEHMHWHFVPRRPDDGLMLPWTNQIKEH